MPWRCRDELSRDVGMLRRKGKGRTRNINNLD
jgi:hypothetical protein